MESSIKPTLAIIIPCYNEEVILLESITTLLGCIQDLIKKDKISEGSFCYFVDDGSTDATWYLLEDQHRSNSSVKCLKLAGNVGHQNALLAGLLSVPDKIDCVISIDADLQDDVTVIEKMIDEYNNGSEIVYGVRKNRTSDTWFKRNTALIFYKLMRDMGVKVMENHADFRLLGKKALATLSQFEERHIFLRGIFASMGFSTSIVEYDRLKRIGGEPKYTLRTMIALAWNGVTSFSVVPLRLISMMGMLFFVGSIIMGAWVLGAKLFSESVLPGWASTVLPLYFIGGIQLLAIGIIGEYLGKVYMEVKHRPRFIREKELED